MVPEYWLTEGGQSATGALLDHVIENHLASPHLANRAASRSEIVCSIMVCSTCLLRQTVLMSLYPNLIKVFLYFVV